MARFRCSSCKAIDAGRQFGSWTGYHPNGWNVEPFWVVGQNCTQEQMHMISNPNRDSNCCDAPLEYLDDEVPKSPYETYSDVDRERLYSYWDGSSKHDLIVEIMSRMDHHEIGAILAEFREMEEDDG